MLLLSALGKEKEFAPLLSALKKENKPVLVTGVSSSLKELFPGAVLKITDEKALILLPDEREAADLAGALSSVFPRTYFFPPRDFSLVRVDSSSRDFSIRRLEALSAVARGEFDCVVTTFEAACQATIPPEVMEKLGKTLSVGDQMEKDALLDAILQAGYEQTHRVEGAGQFATRGDIVDIFLSGEDFPCRVEFFGDEIDAMGYFDPVTQRRTENIFTLKITPAQEITLTGKDREVIGEYLKEAIEKSRPEEKEKRVFIRDLLERMENGLDFARDLFLPLVYRFTTLLDYFGDEMIFVYDQNGGKERLKAAQSFLEEQLRGLFQDNKTVLPPKDIHLLEDFETLCSRLGKRRTVLMENFFAGRSLIPPSGIFTFRTRTGTCGFQDMARVRENISSLREEGYRVLLLCENSLAVQSLSSFLEENGEKVTILDGTEEDFEGIGLVSRSAPGGELIRSGFQLSDSRLAVLTDDGPRESRPKKKKNPVKADHRKKLLSYTDLSVGDYVVHSGHGIGIFRGVEKMKSADGSQKDFIKIAYAGTDVLYVPCSNLDTVSKYIGPKSDSDTLKLHRLGGAEWQKAKTSARKSAKDIAAKLTRLYAQRQQMKGYSFSPDTAWQGEFEEAFPYGETQGQLRATREIKEDMEKSIPMDRLLCGDVGFGKTEVALRGVFKCVMDSKQAAILVPTTILAWQHYQTLLSRFKGYPINIEMISRFRTKKEQRVILEKLKRGEIDILVGTHRLLQDDVSFADLGFLVIDEEQRFGVTHKEKLKELSQGVDVLTLTATPIPRTLNMALGGIKDMSLLEEAPEDRFPVQTYVLEYDRGMVEEAIRRELRRGGQVFYLHNNIGELKDRMPALQRAFPDARIALAHGKMDKDELSDIWKEMMDRQVDILLCTTIIETGVDLPDANTLIVEDADHFGLSQLHQIRGRVGRSDRKAYAFFTYRRGKVLKEISVKRLEAIREYTRFGSGFQIALRDLEIRGAGNLLGAEQSGHLDSVGYDLFMKILSEAVLEERGGKAEPELDCTVDLNLDGFIPEKYVPYPSTRMDLYRKIASLKTKEDAADLTDEMLDRFGDLPQSVENLFTVALLRALAAQVMCEKITEQQGRVTFFFARVREDVLLLLSAVYASRLTLSLAGKPRITLRLQGKDSPAQCRELLEYYRDFSADKTSDQ